MRLGSILLILGLILLVNASDEHVPNEKIYSRGEIGANETGGYVILIAPVGVGNVTVGFFRSPGSHSPPGFEDVVVLPIHIKIEDPTNQTLVEQDIITPHSFEIDFNRRGHYQVHLTNNGTEDSPIPIGLRFEDGNPQNREADKFLLSIILTALGTILMATDSFIKFFSKRYQYKTK